MRRKVRWGIVAIGLAAVSALVAPWSLGDGARREVLAHLEAKTGLKAQVDGRIAMTLAPWPVVKIENAALRAEERGLSIQASVLQGRLRLLPLVAGRVEFAALSLAKAVIDLDTDKALLMTAVPSASHMQAIAHPGRIEFVAATLRLSRIGRPDIRIDRVDASFDWPAGLRPAILSANGSLGGDAFDLALWVENPDALLRGEASASTLNLDGQLLSASFDGRAQWGPRPQAEGKFALSAASMRDVLQVLGWSGEFAGLAGKLSATGRVNALSGNVALTDARVSIDGNTFEGGLSFTWPDDRLLVAGTLATERLQLDSLLPVFPQVFGGDGGWSREPLPRAGFRDVDLDLRLSAGFARLRNFSLKDAGLAIKTADGRADISLLDSRASNGRLKGRFVGASGPAGLNGRLSLSAVRVDAAALLGRSGGGPIVGEATGQVVLEGAGQTVADLVEHLQGRIEASILNGDIVGIDIDQALRGSERRPLSAASELRRGRTSFANAKFTANIRNGQAEIVDALATGFGLTTSMAGEFHLPERRQSLRLTANQANADGGLKRDGAQLNVTIGGAFDNPTFDLDFESLIRRSEAAAPLLGGARKPSQSTAP